MSERKRAEKLIALAQPLSDYTDQRLLGEGVWAAKALLEALDTIDRLENLLGEIELYVKWRYVTKQLATEQKELWADCVDAWSARLHDEPTDPSRADRWWQALNGGKE